MSKKTTEFSKYACGIIIVKSKNSNFNSDFSGSPRRLPDAQNTVYATDKSLKYCIRKYFLDTYQDEKIFMWRRKLDKDEGGRKKGSPLTIDENYNRLFESELSAHVPSKITENLLSCLDVGLFGVTFAPGEEGKNIGITGPVQISYGVNHFNSNDMYTNQILSPFSPGKKGQTTIGSETKGLEYHYVFDYVINPKTIHDSIDIIDEENMKNELLLTEEKVQLFKEAACRAVNQVNSTTKIGSENECFLYFEIENNFLLQNIGYLIEISNKKNGKALIDFSKLSQYLTSMNLQNMQMEIYYNKIKTSIKGLDDAFGYKTFDILTMKEHKS